MHLLVLGGTVFLGRHIVGQALERGHRVTMFTRGRTSPELFPEAEHLIGDRDGDLSALEGRDFDAVIDTSGYVPRVVRDSARLLADKVSSYVFVSSISVYGDFSGDSVDESTAVAEPSEPGSEDVDKDYGALKALCEREVQEVFGDAASVIRPGLIVGPHDPTNRFTYWVRRCAAGGPILAPAPPDGPVQLIDVRDLAAWTLDMIERSATGVYNATSPVTTFSAMLQGCIAAAGTAPEIEWVDPAFLTEQGLEEWTDLPVWLADPAMRALLRCDVTRAVDNGLTFRSIEDTARATLSWVSQLEDPPGEAGLDAARERELLELWGSRQA